MQCNQIRYFEQEILKKKYEIKEDKFIYNEFKTFKKKKKRGAGQKSARAPMKAEATNSLFIK